MLNPFFLGAFNIFSLPFNSLIIICLGNILVFCLFLGLTDFNVFHKVWEFHPLFTQIFSYPWLFLLKDCFHICADIYVSQLSGVLFTFFSYFSP